MENGKGRKSRQAHKKESPIFLFLFRLCVLSVLCGSTFLATKAPRLEEAARQKLSAISRQSQAARQNSGDASAVAGAVPTSHIRHPTFFRHSAMKRIRGVEWEDALIVCTQTLEPFDP